MAEEVEGELLPPESGHVKNVTPDHLAAPDDWGLATPERQAMLSQAKAMRGLKHGILASMPMICRDTECPVKQHCTYQKQGLVKKGDRCIPEIALLMDGAEKYYREFAIDPTDPEARVDAVQVQQLLFLEVLMDRCTKLLATDNLVEMVDIAFSPDGQDVLTQPSLHKAMDALPKLQRRHSEILRELMATRKDKHAMATSTGMTMDQMMKQMIQNAAQVKARQELMRRGELKKAEDMGFEYGINAHSKDTEKTEQPKE